MLTRLGSIETGKHAESQTTIPMDHFEVAPKGRYKSAQSEATPRVAPPHLTPEGALQPSPPHAKILPTSFLPTPRE